MNLPASGLAKPRPPTATSIPAILKSLQDEWDAVMLHSFTLRQQLQTARQELSHALYQHDAACRVIARLTKEVTAAREALATLKPQAGLTASAASYAQQGYEQAAPAAAGDEGLVLQEVGMSEDVTVKIQAKADSLTADRKRRGKTIPEGLASADDISQYRQLASHTGLHSAGVPGLLALDLQLSDTSKVVTGGADKNAVVFNKETEQVIAVLKGHTKKVTSVIYHPSEELVFSASPDASIRVWGVQQAQCGQIIRTHEGPVTGLSLHATGDYLLSSSTDGFWAFSDIQTGKVLMRVAAGEGGNSAATCAQFHPDGLIFGTGTADSLIKIWDLKERQNVANFPGHSGPISAIAFSENGFYLATAADDAVVKLVYLCKKWTELKVLNDHTAQATGVAFGSNASFLASTSMDRSLKFFGFDR
ncbi:PRPF19 [Bugula neritina]|uniref:Pre-mRNA-processing factor 19 n=1 Tax=Bugula neritina TaxID=10212 RepID=A0A7J7J080_BUGNE|nr:PRPF19 [Bugula neritina]